MKMVLFYQTYLVDSTTSHLEIYFEHFEIHPIKVRYVFSSQM